MSTGIHRAREELFAAHLLATTQFAAQAIELAHCGALAAAEAALEALDRVAPAEPTALIAAFLRQVVRERGLDPEVGQLMRSLHNQAVLATVNDVVPLDEAARSIADATALVDAVDDWLTQSEFVTIARDVMRPPRRRKR